MIIKYEDSFSNALIKILHYISRDKKSAAIKFKNDIKKKISLLKDSPFMCPHSQYFEDERYRDLVFKGYTVIYKIDGEFIKVLDIFKWENK